LAKPSKLHVVSFREVGARVRALRQQGDLTQTELAELLGTKQTAVSEIERGKRGLTVQQVVKLAQALKVTPNDILGNDGQHPRPRSARLLRRLHRVEQLPEDQQAAVLKLLDGVLKAHRLSLSA
jgi:transcriptional regulator with XRE-family HTH domain